MDVAVPTDVMGTAATRNDILVISGGLARVPDTMPRVTIAFATKSKSFCFFIFKVLTINFFIFNRSLPMLDSN